MVIRQLGHFQCPKHRPATHAISLPSFSFHHALLYFFLTLLLPRTIVITVSPRSAPNAWQAQRSLITQEPHPQRSALVSP